MFRENFQVRFFFNLCIIIDEFEHLEEADLLTFDPTGQIFDIEPISNTFAIFKQEISLNRHSKYPVDIRNGFVQFYRTSSEPCVVNFNLFSASKAFLIFSSNLSIYANAFEQIQRKKWHTIHLIHARGEEQMCNGTPIL